MTTDHITRATQGLYKDYPCPVHGVVSELVARMVQGPFMSARPRIGRFRANA